MVAVEQELVRLRRERQERQEALHRAEAQARELETEPDLTALHGWLEDVLRQVAGRIARAEHGETLRAALRAALDEVKVDLRGREMEVDIRVRAENVPDVLVWTDAESPLLENARAALGAKPSCTSIR